MSNNMPPPPPPPYGSGGPPPPPPPPPGGGGYQGGPYQQGGHYQQGGPYQGGPHQGGPGYPGGHYPGGPPPKKRSVLPWILGCLGCGGLAFILMLVFFGGIGYFAEQAERAGTFDSDTSVVVDTSVVGTDTVSVETSTDGGSFEGTTDDTSSPADDDSQPTEGTGEGEIKEIQPLNP